MSPPTIARLRRALHAALIQLRDGRRRPHAGSGHYDGFGWSVLVRKPAVREVSS